jgi:hypothetical protein
MTLVSGFLGAHHRVLAYIATAWYLVAAACTVSYGVTQSTSINSYGIQPGTPPAIEILIAPAASIWYLAQLLTYGSVHVCGTFTSPCAWPHTWPGSHVEQNVDAFDDIWFVMFGLTFALWLGASRSVVRSIRALSVPPVLLGSILFFDDNHWFYIGFSDELNRMGLTWLTNEAVMFLGIGSFVLCTIYLKVRKEPVWGWPLRVERQPLPSNPRVSES